MLQLSNFPTFATLLHLTLSHSHKYTPGADKVGIASAIVCAVHCMVVPLLFLFTYSLRQADVHHSHHTLLPGWWESLDYVFLAIGFYAVYHASRHAASRGVKRALWLFWLCLATSVIFQEQLHWLSYIASIGLIVTHFVNIRLHALTRNRNDTSH